MSLHRLSAGGGYEYLLRHTACGDAQRDGATPLTAYYTAAGYPPGRWLGTGSTALGLQPGAAVGEQEMARLFGAGCHPTTGAELGARYRVYRTTAQRVAARLGELPAGLADADRAQAAARIEAEEAARRTPIAVAGFDLTFTAPKSASVLWALADPRTQAQVVAAHRAAVGDVLGLLERHALFTRIGSNGAAQVLTRGGIAAAFDHWDTRTGDPNLHTHVVLANKVQGPDGRWRSVDSRALHAAVVALSEVYDDLVADRITAATGAGWGRRDRGPRRTPAHEISGVPDRLLAGFSTRSGHISVRLQDLVAGFRARHGRGPGRVEVLRLRQQATRDTRPGKTPRALPDLLQSWRAQATQLTGSPDAVVNAAISQASPGLRVGDVDDEQVDTLAAATVAGVQARRCTWNRWNLLAEAARATRDLRMTGAADRLALLDRVVNAAVDAHSVPLEPPQLFATPESWRRPDGASVFTRHWAAAHTSTAILAAEDRLLAAAADTTGPRSPTLDGRATPAGTPAAAAPSAGTPAWWGRGLTEDQVLAVEALAGSGRVLDVLVGPAGTGKTTTLRALRRVWEAAHGPGSVLGLAPSATAATQLAAALGIACETTAKWEHHTNSTTKADRDGWGLRAGQLLIVDEASLAGTLPLDRITAQARSAGAKLVLVGDHHQLSAVEAGGAFGLLARDTGAAELTALWRFRHRWEANASRGLRRGDPAALNAYTEHGRLHDGPAETMAEEVYLAWQAAHAAGVRALLIAPDAATVATLNRRARADLLAAARVEPRGVALHDGTTAGVGDLVATRRNDRRLRTASGRYVRNGDTWTVTARGTDGSLTVRPPGERGGGPGRGRGLVTLPPRYVAEQVELGYATTAHRAQGRTVDAAFALLRPGMSREAAYVALTRGRHANTGYLALDTPDPDCDTLAPQPERGGWQILEAILATSEAEPSASETLRSNQEQAGTLARLVPVYTTLDHHAQAQRWAAILPSTGLTSYTLQAVLGSPAYPALVAALRNGEAQGHDMTAVLPRLAARALPSAEGDDQAEAAGNPAAVLHARVTDWLDDPPPPTKAAESHLCGLIPPAGPLPEPLRGGELDASIRQLEHLITARARALVVGVLADPPAWARPLGPPPTTPAAGTTWLGHLTVVAAYRDLYGLADTDPLTPDQHGDHVHQQAWRRAAAAATSAANLARHRRSRTPEGNALHTTPDRSVTR